MNEAIFCSIDPVVFSILDNKLCVLLFKRDKAPCEGKWALPGGLIQKTLDKSVEDAVERVLEQRTGVKVSYYEQVFSLGGFRDPRDWTLSVVYMAFVKPQNCHDNSGWVPVEQLKDMDLAFDHGDMIAHCLTRLRSKVNYSTLPIQMMDELFTLPDLQKVYELVLGEKLDKSAFRKKIQETDLLEKTNEQRADGAFRPSFLYRLKENQVLTFNRNLV